MQKGCTLFWSQLKAPGLVTLWLWRSWSKIRPAEKVTWRNYSFLLASCFILARMFHLPSYSTIVAMTALETPTVLASDICNKYQGSDICNKYQSSGTAWPFVPSEQVFIADPRFMAILSLIPYACMHHYPWQDTAGSLILHHIQNYII